MNTKTNLFFLELKNFLRARVAFLGLIILFLGGVVGMYFGKHFIDKQKSVIETTSVIQKEVLQSNIKKFGGDLGDFLYSHTFLTVHKPNEWASFSNGQRDVHSYVLPIRMLALEGQMYDTELVNPVSQLLGNLDVAFIFLLVFPLIIVAFSYNVWSQEQESGVWKFVNIQSQKSVFAVLMRKLWIRFMLLYIVAMLVFCMSVIYMKLPVDYTFFMMWLTLTVYFLFWFGVVSLIVSFNRSSTFNAVSLLAIWIILSVFLPAIVNVWLSKELPVPEALSTVVKQRDGYHEKWDQPIEETMKKFYQHYPELKKYTLETDKFTWGWYYAMQQMGDDESELQSKELLQKLQMRQNWTNSIAFFVPTINAQLQFNQLSNTDLQSHIQYLNALKAFHERIRTYFYPIIFSEGTIDEVDFNSLPVFYFKASNLESSIVMQRCLALIVISIGLFIVAYVNIKNKLGVQMGN